jgi:hypothetical protein
VLVSDLGWIRDGVVDFFDVVDPADSRDAVAVDTRHDPAWIKHAR